MSMSDKIRRDFEKCYCCAIVSIHGTKINTTLLILKGLLSPISEMII